MACNCRGSARPETYALDNLQPDLETGLSDPSLTQYPTYWMPGPQPSSGPSPVLVIGGSLLVAAVVFAVANKRRY